MRSIRFTVLSNARKYVTERIVKNGRNDLFSVSLLPRISERIIIFYFEQYVLYNDQFKKRL